MKKIIFILLLSIVVLFVPLTLAKDGTNGDGGNKNKDENEVRIENRFEQRIERDDDSVRVRILQQVQEEERAENKIEITEPVEQKVEIKGNNFEITGEITKIDKDNFVVTSQTIFIDANLVAEFEQKGTLKVGELVKVEGIIIDGKKFAREIVVLRNNQEDKIEIKNIIRDRVEIKGNRFEITGEITKIENDSFVVASQTIFIDPNLVRDFRQRGTLKLGERVRVEGIIVDAKKFAREIRIFRERQEVEIEVKNATEAGRARIEVKARGPFDQITNLLRQILNFFTGQRITS